VKPYYEENGITIYHGDCRDVLPSVTADIAVFDPPYGIGRNYGPTYNDTKEGYWEWFIPTLDSIISSTKAAAHTHRSIHTVEHMKGWDWIAVWNKPRSSGARIGNSPVLPHWEPIFLYGIHTLGTKRDSFPDVITINPETSPVSRIGTSPRLRVETAANGKHPLPKPLSLMKFLVTLEERGQSNLFENECEGMCGV